MKRGLAFLGAGTAWILFSGLMGLTLPPPLNPPPHDFVPPFVFDSKPPSPPAEVSVFFSSLEERWRTDRVLATSA